MSALAPAIFLGLQPRPNGKPPIALFNLTADKLVTK